MTSGPAHDVTTERTSTIAARDTSGQARADVEDRLRVTAESARRCGNARLLEQRSEHRALLELEKGSFKRIVFSPPERIIGHVLHESELCPETLELRSESVELGPHRPRQRFDSVGDLSHSMAALRFVNRRGTRSWVWVEGRFGMLGSHCRIVADRVPRQGKKEDY